MYTCSDINVYQKYLVTSIKVGCSSRSLYASSSPKAEGVPVNRTNYKIKIPYKWSLGKSPLKQGELTSGNQKSSRLS